jgi:hypothetical protein
MTRTRLALILAGGPLAAQITTAGAQQGRNLIFFIPDGLRAAAVTPAAPTLAAVRDQGVNFANAHSLFPTFTMANASGMATGTTLAPLACSATRSTPFSRCRAREKA